MSLKVFMPTVDNVDKRGKKLKKSSSDDLRKYYELAGKWVCLEVWPTIRTNMQLCR